MLLDFPPEIVQAVVKQVTSSQDLKSLCQVSRFLYRITMPMLYDTVTITTTESLHTCFTTGLCCERTKRHLKMVKNFTLEAPFHRSFHCRCLHNHDQDDEMDDDTDLPTCFDKLGEEVSTFLDCVPDNSLRSFSWNLGGCVPGIILGREGVLPRRQKHIEHLSLIGDPGCVDYPDQDLRMNLSEFTKLKSISWRLFQDYYDYMALSGCLAANAAQLQSLTIDLGDWDEAVIIWMVDQEAYGHSKAEIPNFFAMHVLCLESNQETVTFPALVKVSLSSVCFAHFGLEMFHALNIMSLHTLSLWNCPGVCVLVDAMCSLKDPPRLKSLELVEDWRQPDEGICNSLTALLKKFTGLEDLYLLVNSAEDPMLRSWYNLVQGIKRHKHTLKRLVLHERFLNDDELSDQCGGICDLDLSKFESDTIDLMRESNIECFGISSTPCSLASQLKITKPSFKIIHVRSSTHNHMNMIEEYGYMFRDSSLPPHEKHEWAKLNGHDRLNPFSLSVGRREISIVLQETPCPLSSKKDKAVSLPLSVHTDMQCFAQWAFGPNGLPDLRILAFGDFSHKGRYEEHTALLCRDEAAARRMASKRKGLRSDSQMSEWTYRHLRKEDTELQDLLSRHMCMLEACPVDGIYTCDCC